MPSADGDSPNTVASPAGGDRRELSAEAPARSAEYGMNAVATLTGEKMGPSTTTVTICDEDIPGGALPPRHLASRTASEGCSVHSTGSAIDWKPVGTLHRPNKKAHH